LDVKQFSPEQRKNLMTDTRQPSDEADAKQLDMARQEGEAYHRSLLYMANEVADAGGQQAVGDYIVAFAQERAEGMYMLRNEGELEWIEPEEENCHLEISVSDAADGRFIPALDIKATLVPEQGAPIGPFQVPFLWHPGLYHYGRNVTLPGDGRYTLRVVIAPPTFMRHDKINGRLYATAVAVEFKDVQIKTGRE
jgi:uncharacterized protein involved in high-affinity Fe2+ transport